jgi:hypothetical protein
MSLTSLRLQTNFTCSHTYIYQRQGHRFLPFPQTQLARVMSLEREIKKENRCARFGMDHEAVYSAAESPTLPSQTIQAK